MDKLPDVPFKRVLSYLSLEDRFRLSAVSRGCHEKVANSRVKSLCFSGHPIGRISEKSRWVSGVFAHNFISSSKFAKFFNAYGRSVLSSLHHLRLCDLDLDLVNGKAFIRTLNSFDRLEELNIIRVEFSPQQKFHLYQPMLTGIHLEELNGIQRLILKAPSLRTVKHLDCSQLKLHIVHGDSVESLIINSLELVRVTNLSNLKRLYVEYLPTGDRTLLSSLGQLKELHLIDGNRSLSEVFAQKQRYNRADLKIYLHGLLLNDRNDLAGYAIRAFFGGYLTRETLVQLIDNRSRLADVMPLCRYVNYSSIRPVAPGSEVDLWKSFTDLNEIKTLRSVRDIERFLNLLKNLQHIVKLEFNGNQPQQLFDQLPKHCAVQTLTLWNPPADLTFLFRLKHLIHLHVYDLIDSETVRRAFEELPFLSSFSFDRASRSDSELVSIEVSYRPKQFTAFVRAEQTTFTTPNAAIEFIFGRKKKHSGRRQAALARRYLFNFRDGY